MDLLLQRLFDGMFNSAIYASLALALVVINRATGILNFAQGEMATLSAYVAMFFLTPGSKRFAGSTFVDSIIPGIPWPTPLAILGAVFVGMLMGAMTERVLIRPLEDRPQSSVLNVTIGMLIFVNALVAEIWTTATRFFPSPFPSQPDDYFGIAGARLRYQSVLVWCTLGVVMLLLGLFFTKTKPGLAFRAITANREGARLVGIRVNRVLMIGWAIAAGLGALAATLVADSVLLEPNMMIRLLVFSFAAATIGGLDSPRGALIGGVIVGLSQSLVPGYISWVPSELSVLPAVVAMLLVLLVRPQGLFGTATVERV